MTIYADIARKMAPDKLRNLARFREAAKEDKWLPTGGAWDLLPHGFLVNRIENGEVVAKLTPMGGLVADAAEELSKKEAA